MKTQFPTNIRAIRYLQARGWVRQFASAGFWSKDGKWVQVQGTTIVPVTR